MLRWVFILTEAPACQGENSGALSPPRARLSLTYTRIYAILPLN